jgi:S-adenosylmethionine/arginine decarboxylase-like enzyme
MVAVNHFVMDAFKGYRSRLDDILLIHELLEEIPEKLGLQPVMPPFVLPYYNGVIPEDCGISAFVFLAGGHFTIHTFSFREAFFVDLVTPRPLDTKLLENQIKSAFPAEIINTDCAERGPNQSSFKKIAIDPAIDFGPHVMLDFEQYNKPATMDDLFALFDTMPYKIGMTPIMRPYAVKGTYQGQKVISILTMIAESHISLHYFPEQGRAYFDIFSCRFFDYNDVVGKLKQEFTGQVSNEIYIARGSKYQHLRSTSDKLTVKSKVWLEHV